MKKQVYYEINPVNGAPYGGPRRIETLAEARRIVRAFAQFNPHVKLEINSVTMIVKPIRVM